MKKNKKKKKMNEHLEYINYESNNKSNIICIVDVKQVSLPLPKINRMQNMMSLRLKLSVDN